VVSVAVIVVVLGCARYARTAARPACARRSPGGGRR
jgi:hypothetical protein